MSARGDYCRAAMRNIGKNSVSAIDASLDSRWVEQHGGMEGRRRARLVGTGDWPRSRVLTGLPKRWGKESVRAVAGTGGLTRI